MRNWQGNVGRRSRRQEYLRSGISLLEVLIAIMVLSIGLLGLAALIPVGKFEVAQTMIVDRAATLGRLQARDILIRGLLRPEMCLWLDPSQPGSQTPQTYLAYPPTYPQGVPRLQLSNSSGGLIGMPMAIDPLTISHPANRGLSSSPHAVFPYASSNVPSPPVAPPLIARCTLSSYYAPIAQTAAQGLPSTGAVGPLLMDYRQAERFFKSSDDLSFAIPDNQTQRPNQVFKYQGSPGLPVQREFQGDFSWLVTLSPALSDFLIMTPTGWQGQTQAPRTFNISIVVFNKRISSVDVNLNPAGNVPTERIVYADVLGTGYGGGDVILRVPGQPQNVAANLLAVKPQQWLMLVGTMHSDQDLVKNRVVLAWYRVVKVGDQVEDLLHDGSNWGRRATLAGPDWLVVNPLTGQPMYNDVDGTSLPIYGNVMTVHAGLFEGAIAVYDRSVTLDGYSLWQQ